jgi:chromosome segregation ATPase
MLICLQSLSNLKIYNRIRSRSTNDDLHIVLIAYSLNLKDNIIQMEDRSTKSYEVDQSELAKQLREKVRTQAQRLRNLEQYRVLCEQRISELHPGHNFPVRPEDLGMIPPSPTQELSLAKQKISRLEQQLSQQNIKVPLTDNYTFPSPTTNLTLAQLQELYSAIYYQHYNILKDKTTLEESLRAEMLNCEEQRAYIEVLKQALESNLQELGLSGRGIEDILNRVDRNDPEASNLGEMLKTKTEECDKIIAERAKTDQHLKEAAEALQYAEEEVQRLEEEKSALLDYIEENSAKEKQILTDLEKAKKECLDLERRTSNSLRELNSEQTVRKELESELQRMKSESSRHESYKDAYTQEIERLKASLKNAEYKNESLQANSTTLSKTLKETQQELDTLKSQHDTSIKEVSSIKKTLSLSENKLEDIERNAQQAFETNKDLENKLFKAEKDIKNYQKKIKDLEDKHKDTQEEAYNEIEEQKIQLEKVISKEKELSKENAELKKKLKKTQDEALKHQSLSDQTELIELKKKLDISQIQFQQITFEKDKLLTDIQRLEFSLNAEKSSNSILTDENTSLKEKCEETLKLLKSVQDASREKENKLQSCLYELEALKKNFSMALKDIESERSLKTQYYEDLLKLKKSHNSLNGLASQLEDSKKFILDFSSNFGAVTSASNSYNLIISSSFKDLIFKCNEPDNISISEWIRTACEELEALIRRLHEYKQDLLSVSTKLSSTQQKLDNVSIDESALRDRERILRTQIEAVTIEKEKLQGDREILVSKIQTYQNDVNLLRKDLQTSTDEAQRLRDQLNYTTSETIQWRNTAETDVFAIRAIEEKSNLLLKEKKELETLINKLQSVVPSNDLQRVFLELMKSHSELEIINRERLRIENQLLRTEGDMRSYSRNHQQDKAIEIRREVESLRVQLSNCDSQITSYKRRMISLDEEMQELGKCERRRYAMHSETEKSYVQLQEELGYKNRELQNSQLSVYDLKRKQDTEKYNTFTTPQNPYTDSIEDRPLLSYFDKLRRARNLVSDLKDQE